MENKRRKLNYFRLTILCAVLFLAVSGTILIARELHDDPEPEPSPSPSAEVTAEPVQTQTPEPTPTSTPTPTPEETSAEPADEYIFHRAYQMKAFDETPDNVSGFVSGWAVNTTDGYAMEPHAGNYRKCRFFHRLCFCLPRWNSVQLRQ